MITTTMTRDEIYNQMGKDMDLMRRVVRANNTKFVKAIKKMPMATLSKSISIVSDRTHQEYVVCFGASLGLHYESLLAKVRNKTHIWYFLRPLEGDGTASAYSSHFFNRYAERTGVDATYPDIIGKHFAKNQLMIKIYDDEKTNRAVFASDEGLNLCKWEPEKDIAYFCTFVPTRMLKDSQYRAFLSVVDWIKQAESRVKSKRKNEDINDIFDGIENDSSEFYEEADRIYGEYFEDINKSLNE